MKSVVLIAEPQDVLRTGLKSIFLDDSYVAEVHEVTTEGELHLYLQKSKPDFIVINQVLISAVSQLHPLPFLVLAEEPDIERLQMAYKYAARGYLSISSSVELLRASLRSTRHSFLVEPTLMPRLMGTLFHKPQLRVKENILTPREKEIINLLREGLDRIVIANRLGIAEATLKVHLKNINSKSGIPEVMQLASASE